VIVCNTRSAAAGLRNEHVLISYHFTQQDSACVVRDKLNEAGFKVWIDIDDMRAYPYILLLVDSIGRRACLSQPTDRL